MMALHARQLVLSRQGRRLLDDVSLSLTEGQLHVVLGSNGAGKSTLMRLLSREWQADAGSIHLDSIPLAAFSARQLAKQRAVLTQQDRLEFPLTAREVIELSRRDLSPSAMASTVREVMARLDVQSLADRPYPELSGGEQRRVQVARVLAQLWGRTGRRILLLDEPVAGVDLPHQHDLLRLMRELAGQGFCIFTSLHDLNLAARYADHITLLHQGRVIAQGPTATVLTPGNLSSTYGRSLRFVAVAQDSQTHWLTLPA